MPEPNEPREVWAVVFSNYEPAEVDSIWETKADAEKRLHELLETSDMWEVVRWQVRRRDS